MHYFGYSIPLLLVIVFSFSPLLSFAVGYSSSQSRLRVIVETDAGGDPDDEQSLVRFLLYASEWDVEGIIANRPEARPGENRNTVRTGLGIVRRQLDAYGEVYERLKENNPGFPTKQYLWDRTVSGYAGSEDGVNLIISAVDRKDTRPVWFMNWGTDRGSDPSSLARALDKIMGERGQEGYATFKNHILLCSDDKFGDHTTRIQPLWRLWIYPYLPNMDGGRWYHRFGPLTAEAGGFDLTRDVLTGHGPLGALYPTNSNIRQKEGDTGLLLYLIPTGMNDPMQPGWGSWAGRFGVREDWQPVNPNYYWANQRDTLGGVTNRDFTLSRWAADLQNDFRARLDWCVKPFREANHPPIVVVNGNTGKTIMTVEAKPGSTVKLSAKGSTDPDSNTLSFDWVVYPEAGTYRGEVSFAGAPSGEVNVTIPEDAAGKEIHVILTVRDNGIPPLAGYRRMIIRAGSRN
jgi:hypothetical protein